MAAFFGIACFVTLLFAVGGFMENDIGKALKFGAATLALGILTAIVAEPSGNSYADCWIDWDGRTNSTVCE